MRALARFAVLLFVVAPAFAVDVIPREALRYERDLIRNARALWGIDAPIATFAGQIHQESAWRANAKSIYAGGLAQFTPDTANWISGAYSRDLGDNQPFNPTWALRALVIYDKHLWDRVAARAQCDRMAFVLSGYNGGPGWVDRDKKLAASRGADPLRWFGNVELHSGRSLAAFKENRDYPRKILLRWQPLYVLWGPGVLCP